ncbi:hypothetical protein GCM10029992_06780 [Glycomyces albus]
MSTYEYYEFIALDRPLTAEEQAEVRGLSTRAEITATSFTNEYHWGEFKGDPYRMVTRYYDAHLYYTDWGTRELLLKLPRQAVDVTAVEPFWADGGVGITASGKHLIFELTYSTEEPPDYEEDVWDQVEGGLRFDLAEIAGVRREIAEGDHRALYLAWLAAYGRWEIEEDAFPADDEDRLEPPVPPGLKSITGPQRALADFLKLDGILLKVAAEASPNRTTPTTTVAETVAALSDKQKDRLLLRVAEGDGEKVRLELLRKSRVTDDSGHAASGERTVGELLDTAAERRQAV